MMSKENTTTIEEKKISIWEALLPVILLIVFLSYNVVEVYNGADDDPLAGSNQFVLLLGAAMAIAIGLKNKVSFEKMMDKVSTNIKQTTGAILILLLVGALSGTWFISGIIPAMIYYGSQILEPSFFYVACAILCSIIALCTGSSWSTTATIGVALMGIGDGLGLSIGITAGAVVSGAYFGDKMSPMSDTTNLAPAMVGTDLITHIKYMSITTVPSYAITLIIFFVIGINIETLGDVSSNLLIEEISNKFNINVWLFVVPVLVIVLIIKKVEPLIALFIGIILGGAFAVIFQPNIVEHLSGERGLNMSSIYKGVMNSIIGESFIPVENEQFQKLFVSRGMSGMLNTIWIIICAMVFGGVMEAIGALEKITKGLLKMFKSIFGLFASTVASCVTINCTASDQYLSIVVPGKMFNKAYEEKGLAPENLSRTLEDSGTVTSVLIPWNTCGAYQSSVLNVPTETYLPYAFFNLISPFMTLFIVAIKYKIRKLVKK